MKSFRLIAAFVFLPLAAGAIGAEGLFATAPKLETNLQFAVAETLLELHYIPGHRRVSHKALRGNGIPSWTAEESA